MTGTTISHFRVLEKLGAGGMGEVYLAQDTKLDRQVALKVLPPHALASEDDRARFYREARAAAALNHANIATVYEIDEAPPSTESGVPTPGGTSSIEAGGLAESRLFIAMEYVEGESLAERIARGPLPLKEVKSIGGQIADGLHAAHAKGIVHRDIKSSNVMLTKSGEAKILDFGLAKTSASTRLTNLGSTLGTIAYMSPEQVRAEELDGRTDIWSLGAVLYEMITGRVPFPGDYEQAVVYGILNENPEPPTALRTGIPMELERIVAKCLAKDASRRYQHANELAVDLSAVDVRQFGLSTTAPVAAGPAIPRSKSLSPPVVAVLVVTAAALGALSVALLRPGTPVPRVNRGHLLVDQTLISNPALSPDGRLLAFSGWNAGDTEAGLHIYDFETGEVVAVPGLNFAKFSPDGSRLTSYSRGKIFTLSPGGGSPTVMVPEGASWALAWGANRDLYFSTAGFQEVVHVDAAAATPSKVMAVDSLRGEVAVYPYQMLPGGKYLLAGVTRGSPERDDLVAIDVKTGVSTDLLPDAGWIAYYAPSGHLVYVTQQNGPLYVRPFDAARLEITGPVAEARPKVNDQAWAFSASGRFANVVWSEPREHLLRVSFDRNVGVLPVDTMDLQRLRVSPSGRYVAFAASPTGESGWSMSVYDDASSSQLELTYEGVDFGDPAWSPDEKRLAYSMKEETTNRIYVSPSDGSGSPELLVRTAAHSRSPDWSPDGKHIVFETEGNLWLYSFADSTARPLPERLNERGVQLQPRFSPDGRYLTYLSNETGDYELFVALVDGTAKWRITSDGAYAPAWSADQRRIFFLRGSAIAEVRIETAPAFRILGERIAYSSDRELNWFDPMPDDRGFVVAELVEAPTSHFEIVDNWFEYLEEIAPHPD